MIHDFHFLRPLWFLALIPLFGLLWLRYHFLFKRNPWARVCDPHLLSFLLKGESTRTLFPFLWLGLLWLLTILSLAGPCWKKIEVPLLRNEKGSILIFDNSYVMDANDVPPTRLVHARYKVMDILRLSKEGRFGLITYAGEPYIVSPLTEDNNTIENLIPQLAPHIMPIPGNDLSSALKLAQHLLEQGGEEGGNLFLITGNNPDEQAIQTAKILAQKGFRLFVLGIGSAHGGPILLANGTYLKDKEGNIVIASLNEDELKKLALAGHGEYKAFTPTSKDVESLLKSAHQLQQDRYEKTKQTIRAQWEDQGRWLFILILPLFLMGFRRGWLKELLP